MKLEFCLVAGSPGGQRHYEMRINVQIAPLERFFACPHCFFELLGIQCLGRLSAQFFVGFARVFLFGIETCDPDRFEIDLSVAGLQFRYELLIRVRLLRRRNARPKTNNDRSKGQYTGNLFHM